MYVYITASFNMIWIRNWIWISICISRSLFAAAVAPLSHPLQLLADSFAPSSPSLYSFLCKCYICCFFSRFYVYNIYIIYSFFLPFSFFSLFVFYFLLCFLCFCFLLRLATFLLFFLLPHLSTVLLPLFLRRWWRAAPVPVPRGRVCVCVWVWKCATSSASSFSTSSSSYRTDSATPVWVWFDSAWLDSSTGQISWSQLQCRHIASSLLSSLRVCLCVSSSSSSSFCSRTDSATPV